MKTLRTVALVCLLALSAHAKGKVVYQVAFVAKDHLIHYDAKLSAKAALELAAEMNRLRQDEGAKHFVIAVEADQ